MDSAERRVVGTAGAAHATVHAHELSIPIFIAVWLGEYGVSPALLGVVATVAYGCFGLGALPAGVLADRVGAGRLIGASLLASGSAFALVGVAGWLPVAEGVAVLGVPAAVWAIALALAGWGLAASAYHPAGLSLLSTAVQRRGRGFALHGAAGNLGIALGPLATILLLVVLPWETVALLLGVAGGLVGLAALVLDVGSPPAPAAETSLRSELAAVRSVLGGAFLVVLAVVICSGLFYRGVLTFLPEILADLEWLPSLTLGDRDLPAARLGYVAILGVGVLGQLLGGRLSDAVAPLRGIAAILLGLAVLALTFPLAAAAGPAPIVLVAGLLGGALFAVQPLYQATVAEHTPSAARGRSYGVTYLCVFGVGALGGALAGGLLTVASVGTLFAGLAGIAVVGALLAGGLATGRIAGG